MIFEKLLDTINRHNLIEKGDKIVLGISGGPDSVCLLHILNRLKEQFDISYLSALLLNMKGFTTFGEVETYLNPKIEDLYDPFLFKDMKVFMERLKRVILNNERVVIFSDYDCDGVTSSIILYKILTFMKIDIQIVIPNRFTNGYGLNTESIEKIISIGFFADITS